jgi:hypothetical protein
VAFRPRRVVRVLFPVTAVVQVPRLTNLLSVIASRRAALAAGIVACAVLPAAANAQRVLTAVAFDTSIDVPPTVPAGLTTFRLLLKGRVRRELVVHRIPAGTMPEVLVKGAAGRPERWFEHWSFGGPGVPRDSSNEAAVTLDVRPGRYALVSYEVDAAGRPRGDKYIWREVTAIAASILIPSRVSVPDATIRVKDSRVDVTGVLKTGARTLQIESAGARPHELLIGRLKPGKTTEDVRRWDRDRNDPPPFVYVGGLTPMSTGVTAQTRLVLQTGTYVVLCPMRHAGVRDRDYQHGVMASFKVN